MKVVAVVVVVVVVVVKGCLGSNGWHMKVGSEEKACQVQNLVLPEFAVKSTYCMEACIGAQGRVVWPDFRTSNRRGNRSHALLWAVLKQRHSAAKRKGNGEEVFTPNGKKEWQWKRKPGSLLSSSSSSSSSGSELEA